MLMNIRQSRNEPTPPARARFVPKLWINVDGVIHNSQFPNEASSKHLDQHETYCFQ